MSANKVIMLSSNGPVFPFGEADTGATFVVFFTVIEESSLSSRPFCRSQAGLCCPQLCLG
jgi:hypothetical protein